MPFAKGIHFQTEEKARAYSAGYDAFSDGKKPSDNPHGKGPLKSEWSNGWHDARDDKSGQGLEK